MYMQQYMYLVNVKPKEKLDMLDSRPANPGREMFAGSETGM